MKNIKSARASRRAKPAGTTNHSPLDLFAHAAKAAPIKGPIIKPNEKAIPTKA